MFKSNIMVMACNSLLMYLTGLYKIGEELARRYHGMKIFKIKGLPREWVERTHDLRHFKLHSSQRKGFIGTRKVGKSIGNMYCLFNECPSKVLADGNKNASNFQNAIGNKICLSCRHLANQEGCGERKRKGIKGCQRY